MERVEIGLATLYRGDALAVLADLDDGAATCVLTDPPYSSGGMVRGDRAGSRTGDKYQLTGTLKEYPDFTGDNRDQRGFAYWCALWLSECRRVTRSGGGIAMFTDWRQLPTASDVLQAGGWVFRGIAVWDKTEAVRPHKGRYRAQAEFVVWGSHGPMDEADEAPCMPGLWRAPVNAEEKLHLTGKPLSVMRWLTAMAWQADAVVMDPFMGSATTGVAAVQAGKRFIGCELSAEYFAIACRRIEDAQRQGALFDERREPAA